MHRVTDAVCNCCNIVTEHKKMSSALDKCPYCFSNIPKHLIVAIGMKVKVCCVS